MYIIDLESWMHIGKLLALWQWKIAFAVHIARLHPAASIFAVVCRRWKCLSSTRMPFLWMPHGFLVAYPLPKWVTNAIAQPRMGVETPMVVFSNLRGMCSCAVRTSSWCFVLFCVCLMWRRVMLPFSCQQYNPFIEVAHTFRLISLL
jgi:hypothetical protein